MRELQPKPLERRADSEQRAADAGARSGEAVDINMAKELEEGVVPGGVGVLLSLGTLGAFAVSRAAESAGVEGCAQRPERRHKGRSSV